MSHESEMAGAQLDVASHQFKARAWYHHYVSPQVWHDRDDDVWPALYGFFRSHSNVGMDADGLRNQRINRRSTIAQQPADYVAEALVAHVPFGANTFRHCQVQ